MVIQAGTSGQHNWTYSFNPIFAKLEESKYYRLSGIGSYAKDYGTPEYVYLFFKECAKYLGYTTGDSGWMDDQRLNQELWSKMATNTAPCTITTYKWAIAHVKDSLGSTSGDIYYVYRNVNGAIEKSTWGDPEQYVWVSYYKSRIYKNWNYGSFDVNKLELLDYGQTYSHEFDRIIFDCEELDMDDPGFHDMFNYLYGDSVWPTHRPEPEVDPYNTNTNPSQPGGGTGRGRTTDLVDEPDLPDINVIDSGFVTLYAPNKTQLTGLASWMWSTSFYDQFIKLFQNPMDAILSLSIAPFSLSGTAQYIKIGNRESPVSAPKLNGQYISYDLGAIQISEEVGSYLDYAPYTHITLFLPYIGFVPLNTDEVMNTELSIKYHIDLLTGSCVAYLFVNGFVHSQYSGNVFTPIPMSGRDASSLYQSAITVGLSAIGTVATGGLTSALSAGALAASASTVMSSKDRVQVGGSLQGSSGILGIQQPYVIIESPNYCVPANQNHYTGYPSYMTASLGSLSGYTEVDTIHLENIPCTSAELDEIERLLKEGVLL